MKIALNKSDEKGQALILVLILLLLASIIIAPLLGFMGTGLKSGQVFEKKMHQLYAADAGVEDAIWRLQSGQIEVLEGEEVLLPDPPILNANTVKTVEVSVVDKTVEEDEQRTYLITSTAISEDDSSTMIEAYVTNITVWYTSDPNLSHAEVIKGNVYVEDNLTLSADAKITGDVIAEGDVELHARAEIGGSICVGRNLELNNATVIKGNVYAVGNVTLHGKAMVEGDVHAGGDVSVDGPKTRIMGDVHVLPGAAFGGSGEIIGIVYPDYVEGCPLDLGGAEILSWEIR